MTSVVIASKVSYTIRDGLNFFIKCLCDEFSNNFDNPDDISQFIGATSLITECFPYVLEYDQLQIGAYSLDSSNKPHLYILERSLKAWVFKGSLVSNTCFVSWHLQITPQVEVRECSIEISG
jgi:hypothetical protein